MRGNTDCFAWGSAQRCDVLTEVICKKRRCPFFKTTKAYKQNMKKLQDGFDTEMFYRQRDIINDFRNKYGIRVARRIYSHITKQNLRRYYFDDVICIKKTDIDEYLAIVEIDCELEKLPLNLFYSYEDIEKKYNINYQRLRRLLFSSNVKSVIRKTSDNSTKKTFFLKSEIDEILKKML